MSVNLSNQRHTPARLPFETAFSWGKIEETAIRRLSQRCRDFDGCRNLDDGLLQAGLQGQTPAWCDPQERAFLLLGQQADLGRLELLIDPDWRGRGWGSRLLQIGLDQLRSQGCRQVDCWAYGDRGPAVTWLEKRDFAGIRLLFELARRPAPADCPNLPAGWSLRPFQSGQEPDWLRLHVSLQADLRQAWDAARLTRQLNDPTTPPGDFWLLWEGLELRGYLWLKQTEIFLFALHPDCRGQGLGRLLLRWGLSQGDGSARVFCDESRAAALKLYRDLDFQEIGRDRCLRRNL